MAEYIFRTGSIQQFPGKPLFNVREVSGGRVCDFTIKTDKGLVRVSVFDSITLPELKAGYVVHVDGKHNVSDDGKYHSITASEIAVIETCPKRERGVVNPAPASAAGNDDGPGF